MEEGWRSIWGREGEGCVTRPDCGLETRGTDSEGSGSSTIKVRVTVGRSSGGPVLDRSKVEEVR